MASVQEELGLEDLPAWAQPFFDKMKAEICAEVHAKVSYTLRIMLDQMSEDLKQSLKAPSANEEVSNSCYCRDHKKCHSCKTKRAVQRASQCILKKEEKKQAKLAYSAYKESLKKHDRFDYLKSSETDEDNEIEIPTSKSKLVKSSPKQVPIISLGALKPQSVSPRKPIEDYIILEQMTHDISAAVDEIPQQVTEQPEKAEVNCPQNNLLESKEERPSNSDLLKVEKPANEEKLTPSHTCKTNAAIPSFSDSEFEVVSFPSSPQIPINGLKSLYRDSDFYGTEEEQESTTEGWFDFGDFQSLSEVGKSGDDAEEKTYQLMENLVSSHSSSFDSTETLDIGDECQSTVILERQRSPYSSSYSIVSNVVECDASSGVVTNQPLPSEFVRERKPYSKVAPVKEPATGVESATGAESAAGAESASRNAHYRVDNLPESLWEEALTVAAQTYNAAKVAVENLADTFVPGSSPPGSSSASFTRNSSPRSGEGARGGAGGVRGKKCEPSDCDTRRPASEEERQLIEMGFTNTTLNLLLLSRHNHDMDKVVAALIDY